MKLGETIGGFTVVAEPTNSGGGRCMWSFARRDGRDYFIKQFLDPKWPTDESMGSPASKARRREICHQFEQRHQEVNRRMSGKVAGGGNLVTAAAFFRQGTTYYKVTDRVAAEAAKDLTGLSDRQTLVVLRTLFQSMKLLHKAGIVHGDLKPANVLLQRSTSADLYTAKMIDFDDSYLSGDPPPPDQIVGDQQYGAPEWLRYVKQDPGVDAGHMTLASDIFALGLMTHVYLVGELPGYDRRRFGAPSEAVWAGEPLVLSGQLHPKTSDLIARMTSADIARRPTIEEIITVFQDEKVVQIGAATSADSPPAAGGSRVRTNMSGGSKPAPSDGPPPPRTPDGSSRVRINFGTKK
jgi:eukaryotic-like serine/threonine-protein kinase